MHRKTMQVFRREAPPLYLVLLAPLAILIVLFWSQARQAFIWNLANVLLNHATMSSDSAEMYQASLTTLQLLSEFDTSPSVASRRLQANGLLWRSASTLGLAEEGLQAYTRFHGTSDDSRSYDACPGGFLQHIEAADFSNVSADGLARPRKIGSSSGTGVILFTTVPSITHEICLSMPGIYTVAVAAVAGNPPPIEIEITLNGSYAGTLQYVQGSDNLVVRETRIALPAGKHLLALHFANDYANKVLGIDRNALIDYIEISGP